MVLGTYCTLTATQSMEAKLPEKAGHCPKSNSWMGMRCGWHSYVCKSSVSWCPGTILLQHRPTPCPSHLPCQLATPTCLMHCRRSLVCWMCLSIEFILAVSLGPTREP